MLSLTRIQGQATQIGDAIVYAVVKGNRVVLTIDAPRETRIVRGELIGLATLNDRVAADRLAAQHFPEAARHAG